MTITISQVTNTQSFGTWLQRTNDIVTIIGANAVTTDSTSSGSVTTGNGYVNGFFGANNLFVNNYISGGTMASPNTLYITSNVNVVNATAFFGNNSANVVLGYLSSVSSIMEGFGNQNNYVEMVAQNANNGTSSSTDFTAYNDYGLNSNTFIDFGINSSNWSNTQWTINGPSDGYIYVGNSNFSIGTQGQAYINFFANGTLANNEVMRLTSGANVGIGNTNPNAKLQVTGTANISGNVAFGGVLQVANTLTVTGNATFSNTINATGLVTVNTFNATVANSTNINASNNLTVAGVFQANSTVVNAASFAVGTITSSNGFFANSSYVTLGNSSVNTYITANGITTNTVNTYIMNVFGLFIASNTALGNILPPIGFSNTYSISNSSLYYSNSYIYSMYTNSVSPFSSLLTLTSNTNISGVANIAGNTTITGFANISANATIGGAANVTGNVAIGGVVSIAGINTLYSNTFNFSSTTQITVDSFSTSTFRSAEYLIELTDSGSSSYQLTKILLIHDGTNAYVTEFGTIVNNSSLCSFVADVNSGSARLRGTPATSTVVAKFTRNTMAV
jgi:hypothetical protein